MQRIQAEHLAAVLHRLSHYFVVGDQTMPFLEHHSQFLPGEVGTQALVRTTAERQVPDDAANSLEIAK